MRKIVKLIQTKATSIDEANKTATFKISDNQVDRMGEIVDQESWDFKEYMDNPMFLWGHNPDEPENVLGRCIKLWTSDDGSETYGTFQFDTDINPKAELVFNQVKRGSLRTVSVGFISNDEERQGDIPVLKNNKLLETSVVPIPANPRAVALDYKAGVISKKDAQWLLSSMRKSADFIEEQLKQDAVDGKEKEVSDQLNKNIAALLGAVTAIAEAQKKTEERFDRFIEAQERSITEKGAVADELAEDEVWEKKWERLEAACDIWYAFLDVYFDEDTASEDFDKLLGETIELLSKLKSGESTEAAEDDEGATELAKAIGTIDSAHLKALVLQAVTKQAPLEDGDTEGDDEEKATPDTDLPTAPEDTEWDADAAIKSVKEWASDDDGNIDFAKYARAFFWHDAGNAEKQGGYKLPFATVMDGELKAVWHGVAAAYGVMEGAQGGVDIPEDDRDDVLAQIKKYYEKFGKEWPQEAAKDGDIDQPGAAEEVELDLEAELTPELQAQIERALH